MGFAEGLAARKSTWSSKEDVEFRGDFFVVDHGSNVRFDEKMTLKATSDLMSGSSARRTMILLVVISRRGPA